MQVELKVETAAVKAALDALGKQGKAAAGRALDRTIVGTREVAVDMALAELNLRPAKARKRITSRRSFGTLEARVTVKAAPSPLLDFVGTSFAKKSRRGVAVRTMKKGARVRLRHAFILQLKSGPRVFERARSGGRFVRKLPVVALTSLFVAQLLGKPKRLRALSSYAVRRFDKEFRSELAFRVRSSFAHALGGNRSHLR